MKRIFIAFIVCSAVIAFAGTAAALCVHPSPYCDTINVQYNPILPGFVGTDDQCGDCLHPVYIVLNGGGSWTAWFDWRQCGYDSHYGKADGQGPSGNLYWYDINSIPVGGPFPFDWVPCKAGSQTGGNTAGE